MVGRFSITEIVPSTLPSTSRSSLPEISPFSLRVGPSHEVACATLPVGLTLIAETFGALKVSTTRPEGGLGADCDSLFRHTVPPRSGLESRTACMEARSQSFPRQILTGEWSVG